MLANHIFFICMSELYFCGISGNPGAVIYLPAVQYKFKVDGSWATSPCDAIVRDSKVRDSSRAVLFFNCNGTIVPQWKPPLVALSR